MAKQDAFYEAYVTVLPEASQFGKSLDKQIGGDMRGSGATAGTAFFGGMQGSLGSLLLKGGGILAGIGGAQAFADAFVNAINDASTYEQASEAVEDVFGQLGYDAIAAFAESGAETVGQSMNDILQSSSILGLIGKNAGLAGKDLEEFTTSLITLGADLSAFANTSPQEAVDAIMAGFRGEADPLEKYGVFLNDATLKQKALELGIYDGNGALSSQQRILAAYGAIMDATSTQQGAFAAQADTLAGKQATLAASLENISTEIGAALLPTITELAETFLEKGVPALQEFADWFNQPDTQSGIATVGEILKFTADAALFLGQAFGGQVGIVQGFFGILNGVSFEELKTKLTELPGFWGDVFTAAVDMGTGVGTAVGTVIGHVKRFGMEVGANFAAVKRWFTELPMRIAQAVQGASMWLYQTGRDLIQGFVNGITSMVTSVYTAITDTVGGAIDWAKGLLGIASPSKVFAGIGADTARGYAVGIEREYGTVRNATAGMTSAAREGVGPTYVQNPFTGEYLLAQTAAVADGRIASYDAASKRQDDAGKRRRY